MKVLVVGGGGREHALVRRLRERPWVEKIWCAPGNGGLAAEAECVAIDAGDVAAIVAFAEKLHPDLPILGPERPLGRGMTDPFRHGNCPAIGPSNQEPTLEGAKDSRQ